MTLGSKKYFQMNGLGNKILVVDMHEDNSPIDPQEVAKINKTPGLSFDQLMVLREPKTSDTLRYVQIFNSDGSEARACGNGTRCVAWYLSRENEFTTFSIETVAGILICEKESEWQYRVDMGEPKLDWQEIPLASAHDTLSTSFILPEYPNFPDAVCVNMGNPHIIFFVPDVASIPLRDIGPILEHDALLPDRANVSFVQVDTRTHLIQRVWERGAGATRACGTGACAALVAGARRDLTERHARVSLPGGDLHIEWRDNNHVMLQGPVELESEGNFTF